MNQRHLTAAATTYLATAITGLAVGATAIGLTSGAQADAPTTLHFTVPVAQVHGHVLDNGRRGMSAGDTFQETYHPAAPSSLRRQDASAVATFGKHVEILGTVRLGGGKLVYAGTTTDMDNATYAILGGTGDYTGAGGTVTLASAGPRKVRVTISLG